jgi:L-cysteine desulfidase
MEKRPKKAVLAAISAAVTTYIKTQEEALAATAVATAAAGPVATAGSFYAAYGRQQMMDMRRLLSLRMGRR